MHTHLAGHGGVNALLHNSLELVHVVGDATACASAGEGWANDQGEPAACREGRDLTRVGDGNNTCISGSEADMCSGTAQRMGDGERHLHTIMGMGGQPSAHSGTSLAVPANVLSNSHGLLNVVGSARLGDLQGTGEQNVHLKMCQVVLQLSHSL